LPGRLDGIGVHVNAALAAYARDVADRLNDTRLVVRQHHRDQTGVGAESGKDALGGNDPTAVGCNDGHLMSAALELLHRLEARWMLDGGCNNVITTGMCNRAEDGRVVRLRSTAGEDDFACPRADQPRHGLASLLESAARRLAFFMNAGSVTVYSGKG